MRIKRKSKPSIGDVISGRKELFGFISKKKYPSVDRMILHLARKQTHYPPAISNNTPIQIISPAFPRAIFEQERTRPGAQERTADQDVPGVGESKEETPIGVANPVENLEGIESRPDGKIYNPHTKRWNNPTPTNIANIRAGERRSPKKRKHNK